MPPSEPSLPRGAVCPSLSLLPSLPSPATSGALAWKGSSITLGGVLIHPEEQSMRRPPSGVRGGTQSWTTCSLCTAATVASSRPRARGLCLPDEEGPDARTQPPVLLGAGDKESWEASLPVSTSYVTFLRCNSLGLTHPFHRICLPTKGLPGVRQREKPFPET